MPVESKMNASDVEKAVTAALQKDAALKKAHRKKMLIAGIVGGLVIALALAGAIWWVTTSIVADFESLY